MALASAPRHVEALIIGNELLDGRVVDSNTLRLARTLHSVGLNLERRTTVVDDVDVIAAAARDCSERGSDLCIVSGGLGPTRDDVTAAAFARLAGVELVRDPESLARIETIFAARGFTLTENQRRQADRPAGAEIVDNPTGTAPGFALRVGGCCFVCVPGVPREFEVMVAAAVVEPVRALGGGAGSARHELRLFGLIEGDVDERLAPIGERWPSVNVGYRAAFPEIHITLVAATDDAALSQALAFARRVLARYVFTEDRKRLAEVLLGLLRDRRATLGVVESCTGGLIGDLLTDVPGSSDVFRGAIVAYHNDVKLDLARVAAETLERDGAVSEATVVQMAAGARHRLDAIYGIAVSGIAGPDGGTAAKPVGTVWMGVSGPDLAQTRLLNLPFDRRRNKMVSAYAALDLLRRAIVDAA